MEARKGRYIHPVTREYATDAADGLPMLWTCHTATEALHRLCASSPGSIWGFPGAIGIGKGIRFQMGIIRLHAVRRYFGAPWWRSRSVPG